MAEALEEQRDITDVWQLDFDDRLAARVERAMRIEEMWKPIRKREAR